MNESIYTSISPIRLHDVVLSLKKAQGHLYLHFTDIVVPNARKKFGPLRVKIPCPYFVSTPLKFVTGNTAQDS
jgi:hypothetical protein